MLLILWELKRVESEINYEISFEAINAMRNGVRTREEDETRANTRISLMTPRFH
jgi:hypothetical protein